MTPEEYEQYKQAEKEHLKKLKELKQAVHVLERQKKIQSTLHDMSRSSKDALDTQEDMVERLALETAHHEARLEVALDSSSNDTGKAPREELEEDLRRERARSLVEELKASMQAEEGEHASGGREEPERPPDPLPPKAEAASVNPTRERKGRPDKTIGRM